jgi:adenosine kinase
MADAGLLSMYEVAPMSPDLVVISPNDPGAMRKYTEECQALGIPYLYDPSQQVVRVDPADIRLGVEGAESLFVNEYEYELIQKHTGMTPAEILARVKFMVVTCGEDGARIYEGDRVVHVPAVPAILIADPTGVGDAFRAGFLTGLRLGMDWQTCGQLGALCATYCLEQRGTQNHFFTPVEFMTRYKAHFGDNRTLEEALLLQTPNRTI